MSNSFKTIIGLLIGMLVFVGCNTETETVDDDALVQQQSDLAQCLADQGIEMYGAFWCPHCEDQKELFGDAVDQIPYVECDPAGDNADPQACFEKEVESYPTWIHPDGRRWLGTQPLEELDKIGACGIF